MSDVLRPYRDLFPQIGQRVMIDDSSVVIGDVRLADDVGIWPLVVIRGDVHMYRSEHAPISRMAVCCMSLINPRTTQMATH
ncbi:transferase [Escherichia coli]|uniref:Transferase n=1 Tax=Escherichia coli TaxID=562 RepID=A0A376Y2S7_ECOLX|nr:transferase [Escherichia coli]